MDKLGLKRHTVKLIPHQDVWEEVFNATKQELHTLIGRYCIDIQHVGSTAIKGIAAKPIIDIAILMSSIEDLDKIISILESNGFEYRGDARNEGGHLFVRSTDPDVRTHHIHLVRKKSPQWDNYLFFRDELNRHRNLAEAYSQLKEQLAAKYPADRKAYTSSKHFLIQEVLARRRNPLSE